MNYVQCRKTFDSLLPLEVLGNELMAEGNQNEHTPCITVKVNIGKHSTDLNKGDLRSIAINFTQRHFFLW